ncbi:MAG: hypothetical protein UW68_C0016G0022 [Candidatus Collierbacteria bacterium GW2011_GWB1_44_6]|uniref:Uncharacterized protein n=2 Tax=Candidatus Collieribacteriota TaxID=1752725 RepID=A0A0G1LWF2_9BACT|nr:MAG: hypothetical protein UV68_C0017G0011 [Candidatus Collierbacteria bacterium GW2011_GWC2_43_12]KKT73142.1 MAG: hypothetical protein UW68_C0016G0022 [Candidatus Collierbacteria bacterium GW2011_GWB1_44_6]KKT82978.1 MAG: hypothetical protein UW80_C0025G0011 [Microgenomates group bacterium GW2011_GWC1_44_9]
MKETEKSRLQPVSNIDLNRFLGYPKITNESGGSLSAKAVDGETDVALTRLGEFVCKISDDDNFAVNFPEIGLICIYQEDGSVGLLSLDLTTFLDSQLSRKAFLSDGEKDIALLMSFLKDQKQTLMISAFPDQFMLTVEILGSKGQRLNFQEFEQVDFSKGTHGDLELFGVSVGYQFVVTSDEMTVAAGDSDPDRKLLALAVSNKVDFVEDYFSEDPKRFQKLAAKVLLN